jgi:hypothetical protein
MWVLSFHAAKEPFLEELNCVHRGHIMKSVGFIHEVMAYILVWCSILLDGATQMSPFGWMMSREQVSLLPGFV